MRELRSKIEEWLLEQGYPLEMRVSKAFRAAGYRTIQSDYFFDEDIGAEREIDVVASMDTRIDELIVRVEFVIECKQTKSKPWLLFTSDDARLAAPARVRQRIGSRVAACALEVLCQKPEAQQNMLFSDFGPTAYGATQALTSGKDVAFGAMASVSAAALAHGREHDKVKSEQFRIATFVFPIIVIEGKLFACELEESGVDLTLSEIEGGTVIWRSQRARIPHTIIQIVTEESLDEFLQRMKNGTTEFLRNFTEQFTEGQRTAQQRYGSKFLIA